MSTAELVQEIKRLSKADRLEVVEAAMALVRQDIAVDEVRRREANADRMRAAAFQAKELYEPGGELVEWTALDGEEILDDSTIER